MNQPKTLLHTFTLLPLRNHFTKTPNPASSNRLIDLPGNDFLDTEEDITVVAAALYVLCVKYDQLPEDQRAKEVDEVRKWIIKNRLEVMEKLQGKIEPPFHDETKDSMMKDVSGMMEELVVKTLPPADVKK